MGFFSKIWDKTKSFFSKVGKTIKKVFKKVGKFTNKLGIVGQIGMMIAVPYLASWALPHLATLGTNFMTGLSNVAAGKGFVAGAARVGHSVLSTVANVASTGMEFYDTVSGAVSGVIDDATRGIGKALGLSPTATTDATLEAASYAMDPYAIPGKEMPASVYKIPRTSPDWSTDFGIERTEASSRPVYAPEPEVHASDWSTDAPSMASGSPVYAPEPEVYASESSKPGFFERVKDAAGDVTKDTISGVAITKLTEDKGGMPPVIQDPYGPRASSNVDTSHTMSRLQENQFATMKPITEPLPRTIPGISGNVNETYLAELQAEEGFYFDTNTYIEETLKLQDNPPLGLRYGALSFT